ncbi:acetate--CoA ligase [Nemorincola caseinilytica]
MKFRVGSYEEYKQAYAASVNDPSGFWAGVAEEFLWRRQWDKVLEWDFRKPDVKWFMNGRLNITENCLDRHLATQGDKPAIIWEPNDPGEPHRTITYRELHEQVCRFAAVLRRNGIQKGDRVCIYMGMVLELPVAMLACARIGAIHSVIFGGFSAQSIADRLQDAGAEYMITCDGGYRGAKDIPLKATVDDALSVCGFVKRVIVLQRTGIPVTMTEGRDVWWHDEVAATEGSVTTAEEMDAEDPLFILYTSGSTGKPKGVVHTTAGYMVYATYSFVNVFQVRADDIHFCTADIGWITGHSYIVYGVLCAGGTSLLYEGIPTWPDAGRFWDIVGKHRATILYTAPTAIRSLMAYGTAPLQGRSLASLRVLGTVGEPINEEAWHWYNEYVGGKNCPIVDTWWQTENGGIMISNLAGVTPAKPGYATLPLPGIQPVLVDEKGDVITGNDVSGNLCIRFPWPGMLRTTWGDHERCRLNYFAAYDNMYFTGDGCYRDEQGMYRITGRVDDVLNVSGHRIGTAEVENAINMHEGVLESAVVGFPHDVKGQGIYAYVIMESMPDDDRHMHVRAAILVTVTEVIGPIARPDKIQFVSGLPKTRSGKIMRRILRKIAEGEMHALGDTSTLLDPAVVDEIKRTKV